MIAILVDCPARLASCLPFVPRWAATWNILKHKNMTMSFPGFRPSVGLTILEIKADSDPKRGIGAPASLAFARPPLPLALLWPQ